MHDARRPQGSSQQPSRVLKASLDTILQRYIAETPTAQRVLDEVYRHGYGEDQVAHDHLAFRTFGLPGLGLEALGAAFQGLGYSRKDTFTFPHTHLLATWYAPPPELYDQLPRLFVSQLQIEQLSPKAQAIVHSYTSDIPGGSSAGAGVAAWAAALTGALPWRLPTHEDYVALLQESEYGAWVLVNGYRLNHTALSVHRIAQHSGNVAEFAAELQARGFVMNEEGGLIKASPDGGLLQCSTVADVKNFTFADGQEHRIAAAYMEFVERKPAVVAPGAKGGPLGELHRRDGFEAASARDIFASTTLAALAAQKSGGI